MDLDNIDNVFRMAHYLGFEGAGRESVVRLVDALRLQPGDSHFTVSEDVVPDAMLWQRLRHDVYKTFIYDAAYLSFECQIFEFIAGLLARVSDPTEIEALGEFPDDVLLWEYFADPSYSEMRPLIRRLIACESYECLYIGRIENAALCKSLPSAEEIRNLRNQFVSDVVGALKSTTTLVNEPVLARWLKGMKSNQLEISPPMHFHVTTDKRKTGREILLSVGASPEQARSLRIGDDRYFVVCALFTETALNEREQKFVKECFEESIARWAGERPETIYVMSPARRQLQLPI